MHEALLNKPIRILLVDDSAPFVQAAGEFLHFQESLFVVSTAADGAEALAKTRADAVDVILLDLNLGDSSGLDLIPLLREQLPQVKIIALTMLDENSYRAAALQAGVDAFVHKSSMSQTLVTAILKLTGQCSPTPSHTREPQSNNDNAFKRLIENSQDLIYRYEFTPKRGFTYVNPIAVNMTGYTPAEHYADPDLGLKMVHPDDRPLLENLSLQGDIIQAPIIFRCLRKDGSILWMELRNVPFYDGDGKLGAIEGIARDITARKKAEAKIAAQARLLDQVRDPVIASDEKFVLTTWNCAAEEVYGWKAEEVIGKSAPDLFRTRYHDDLTRDDVLEQLDAQREFVGEVKHQRADGTWLDVEVHVAMMRDEHGKPYGYNTVNRDITERKRVEAQLRYQALLLQNVNDAIVASDAENRVTEWNAAAEAMYGWNASEVIGRNTIELFQTQFPDTASPQGSNPLAQDGKYRGEATQLRKDGTRFPVEIAAMGLQDAAGKLTGYVSVNRDITERKSIEAALKKSEQAYRTLVETADDVILLTDLQGNYLFRNSAFYTGLGYEVGADDDLSFLNIVHPDDLVNVWTELEKLFTTGATATEYRVRHRDGSYRFRHSNSRLLYDEEQQPKAILSIIRDTTDRKRVEEHVHQQLERLAALRQIDRAIASSVDLNTILRIVVTMTAKYLQVDAVNVLLLDPLKLVLRSGAHYGFTTAHIGRTSLRPGEGYAGRAVLERRIVHVANLQQPDPLLARAEMIQAEKFVVLYAVPLIVKGEVKGVLEIFHRSHFEVSAEWGEFLETFAEQTAIAIDNAQLFQGLEKSNAELALAYNQTIEGWSRAMDVRDKETEGHCRRVADVTWQLARQIGMSDTELVHVRRGALLHDIGKLGVPDSILLKPGPLTEQERAIMQIHPTLAYELLSAIDYFRPALDIPYCHHEKWDGTGYPRGLKGEEIPLAARVFAVVDVWDALRSDRPYRKAWAEDQVREYILSLAGTHFDPNIVTAFLEFSP